MTSAVVAAAATDWRGEPSIREATEGASGVREMAVRSMGLAVVSEDTMYAVTFFARARILICLSSSLNVWPNRNVTKFGQIVTDELAARPGIVATPMDDHRRGRT